MRFVPSYGGSLQVLGSPDRCHLVGEHIHCPAHSRGSCPPVGVLITSGLRLLHWECICHPAHSGGSCPPMWVLFEFWEVQVIVAGECVHRVVRHPTHSIGFCPPVGVLFEFQEVQVVIVLLGTRSSCCSLSHSFHFVIWPSLSVSNA